MSGTLLWKGSQGTTVRFSAFILLNLRCCNLLWHPSQGSNSDPQILELPKAQAFALSLSPLHQTACGSSRNLICFLESLFSTCRHRKVFSKAANSKIWATFVLFLKLIGLSRTWNPFSITPRFLTQKRLGWQLESRAAGYYSSHIAADQNIWGPISISGGSLSAEAEVSESIGLGGVVIRTYRKTSD